MDFRFLDFLRMSFCNSGQLAEKPIRVRFLRHDVVISSGSNSRIQGGGHEDEWGWLEMGELLPGSG